MRYEELSEAIEVARHAVTLSGALVDSLVECILENWREPIESTDAWISNEFTTAADAALTNIDLWRKNPSAPKGPRVKTAFNSSVGELDARFHPGTHQIEIGVKYKSLIAGCLSQIYLKLQKDKTKPDAKLARQLILAVIGRDKEGNRYPLRNTIYMFASKLMHEYVHGVQAARQNKPMPQSSYLEKDPTAYQNALKRMKAAVNQKLALMLKKHYR